MHDEPSDSTPLINEDRLWAENGWRAQIIKNEDDEGWAVAMYQDGQSEPRLVGPWTMGRDKKNPKPLSRPAFLTLVKTANEFVGRIEQQLRSQLHKEIAVGQFPECVTVHLDIIPSEDFPSARLLAFNDSGTELGRQQVDANFKLTMSSAEKWIESDYQWPH